MYVKMSNGKIYAVFRSCDDFFIYARKRDRMMPGFQWVKGCTYRKKIDPYGRDVEEYYEIGWNVIFDVGIPGAPGVWRIDGRSKDLAKDLARNKLVLTGGNYDGWTYLERGLSSKEFDFRDASGQYVEKYVYARKGVKYLEPKVERVDVTKDEFIKSIEFYDPKNL
ncbi:MAG: hypothetical protein K6F51_09495 [Acetatifactor sp.]|nr:hypothetical protein [Acetatifactor sp.]